MRYHFPGSILACGQLSPENALIEAKSRQSVVTQNTLHPLMARKSIAQVVLLLTLAAGVLSLPNLALYFGVHEWTAAYTGGVVDARFIAVRDTVIESPLGQGAIMPMLAWIAGYAPSHLKAALFAVMVSFTNIALSASSLGTKYLNACFVVTRAATNPETGEIV